MVEPRPIRDPTPEERRRIEQEVIRGHRPDTERLTMEALRRVTVAGGVIVVGLVLWWLTRT